MDKVRIKIAEEVKIVGRDEEETTVNAEKYFIKIIRHKSII